MRKVIVDMTLSLLEKLLCLPEGVNIDDVELDFSRPTNITLRLVGDGLPEKFEVAPSGMITEAKPIILRDSTVVWNWDSSWDLDTL